MRRVALILAGHGSHISAETAGVVWRYVDALRRLGVADEITACFWKEAPALSRALDTVIADDIVVVPVFTAQGYFAGEVIPQEMGITAGLNKSGGTRIYLTPTIGEHLQLEAIALARLRGALARHRLDPAQTAAAIIGHGSPRSPRSRKAAARLAASIRRLHWLRQVEAVYLDDEPAIASIYRSTSAPHLLALPFFLAAGSHVSIDVPRALGIDAVAAPQRAQGRTVYYCEPVGSDETICGVILDLARESGLPFTPKAGGSAWSGFPSAGHKTFLRALAAAGELQLGQLRISAERVRPLLDESAGSRPVRHPAALRQLLRAAPFRPLPTRTDLPRGWHVPLESSADAPAVVETVYPGLLADWAAARAGKLRIETLADIGKRQRGMFQDIQRLPPALIQKTISEICGDCSRQPVWWRAPAPMPALPCPAACNVWLSAARNYGDAKL